MVAGCRSSATAGSGQARGPAQDTASHACWKAGICSRRCALPVHTSESGWRRCNSLCAMHGARMSGVTNAQLVRLCPQKFMQTG